ncbi:MAG: HNH endonuclease signature motif containing protein [Bacillota bacterium]
MNTQYNTKEQKHKFYNSKAWRSFRQRILAEQNFECQECKRLGFITINNPNKHKTLDVDHIKELSTHPELAFEPTNMRVLCVRHHNEKHGRVFEGKPNPWSEDEKW